ncbi:heat shock protein [Emticicia oligotrophica DSM 17448]|uniref:Heat shock protein n=1 Tax=Emticicia oligotrophica (strain DSM 17448 / CIP 109782 / MTCC 6937 / GPTSA100-15) TaxID=929562 RepID=A0ABM5MX81_EMTOG|nr:Hsp70 family protein [Emticicia oligotrophica]AFK01718.1 heat shock protein [Emticicia oligotrophica DSM 17448]
MSKYIYGIDFGTTNSALAILDTNTNQLVKLFTIPSLLFFPEPTHPKEIVSPTVGHEAVSLYVKNRMRGRFMKSIKKVLPNKSFIDTRIGSKSYRAEDLVALILIHLKKLADDFTGENITTAVIGRPVVFDENPEKDAIAQERLSKAAQIAGFEEFYFQMEPIGAAFTYERQIEQEQLVLVADFGGGTSDFSLMRLNPNAINQADRRADMLAQGGIYIGGDSFDSDIMWHKGTPHFGRGVKEEFTPGKPIDLPLSYFTSICSWEKMNFLDSLRMKLSIAKSYQYSGKDYRVKNLQTLIEQNLGYVIFKEIEKVKIELTKDDNATFSFNESDISINEPISINEFSEEIIESNLSKINQYLNGFLERNHIKNKDVDVVFMTGGTSMVRPLNEIFVEHFGKEKIKSGDNFNSVAMGLAYSYHVLAGAVA